MECNTQLPYAALLFDMDGLMLDTETLSARAWRLAAAELVTPLTDAHLHAMIGLSMPRCLAYLSEAFADEELAIALEAASRRHYHAALQQQDIPLKPGILELLGWCRQQAIPRAVGTATQRQLVELKLTRSGLAPHFSHSVAGDEVANSKPAPDIYLAAAAKLGTAPQHCIVLEDSAYGAQAALAAGMRVIIVPDLQQPPPQIAKQALAVCQDLFAAQRVLSEISRLC